MSEAIKDTGSEKGSLTIQPVKRCTCERYATNEESKGRFCDWIYFTDEGVFIGRTFLKAGITKEYRVLDSHALKIIPDSTIIYSYNPFPEPIITVCQRGSITHDCHEAPLSKVKKFDPHFMGIYGLVSFPEEYLKCKCGCLDKNGNHVPVGEPYVSGGEA